MNKYTGPIENIVEQVCNMMINDFPTASPNQFKSGKVYHRDGTTSAWRNYAIIKTEGREFKAPIITK